MEVKPAINWKTDKTKNCFFFLNNKTKYYLEWHKKLKPIWPEMKGIKWWETTQSCEITVTNFVTLENLEQIDKILILQPCKTESEGNKYLFIWWRTNYFSVLCLWSQISFLTMLKGPDVAPGTKPGSTTCFAKCLTTGLSFWPQMDLFLSRKLRQ